MGFGGSVLSMIQSIKYNASLRRKGNIFKDKHERYSINKRKLLEFKKVSDEELEVIKAKIRYRIRKRRIINTALFLVLSIAITLFFFWFLYHAKSNL